MANNPGSYLEKILQDPSTYDKTSSNAALVYGVVPVLMLIITAFVGARAIKTIPEAWRQIKNPPSRPNMGPQMWVGEGTSYYSISSRRADSNVILTKVSVFSPASWLLLQTFLSWLQPGKISANT